MYGVIRKSFQKALLLHCAGMEVQDIFETLTDPGAPDGEDDNVYKAALRTLDAYFTPQVNVPYERHMFRQMRQEENETVDQFVVRLSNQAANCEFGTSKNEKYVIKLSINASPRSFDENFWQKDKI